MPWGLRDPKEMGFYMALSQVGLEFVAPMVLGILLDFYLHTMPWVTVIGAILGFIGGMFHLVALVSAKDRADAKRQQEDRTQ